MLLMRETRPRMDRPARPPGNQPRDFPREAGGVCGSEPAALAQSDGARGRRDHRSPNSSRSDRHQFRSLAISAVADFQKVKATKPGPASARICARLCPGAKSAMEAS